METTMTGKCTLFIALIQDPSTLASQSRSPSDEGLMLNSRPAKRAKWAKVSLLLLYGKLIYTADSMRYPTVRYSRRNLVRPL